MSTQVPTVWNQLAETMCLRDSPTAKVRLSELASFSFGRFQSNEGLPEIARPIVGERGYIIVLQLKAIPFIEQFLGKRKVSCDGVTTKSRQCWASVTNPSVVAWSSCHSHKASSGTHTA